jgi:antitoxin VapB
MPLSIKNDDTERLIRRIAKLTGESLTDAVRVSVAERYDRLTGGKSGRTLADELNEIALRCARRPGLAPHPRRPVVHRPRGTAGIMKF